MAMLVHTDGPGESHREASMSSHDKRRTSATMATPDAVPKVLPTFTKSF